MPNLSDKISNEITTHTVDLMRVAEDLRETLLQDFERLESELISELQDAAGKTDFTIARLRALLQQTQGTIQTAYDGIDTDTGSALEKLAKLASRAALEAVNTSIGAEILTVAMSARQLETIASDTLIFGAKSADWWAQQSATLVAKFSREMRDGQFRGESIDELVRRVRGTKAMAYKDGIMQVTRAQGEALVRTSVIHVSNAARMETFSRNQDVIKGLQWVATLDNRTCEICAALDGLQWEYPEKGDDQADYVPIDHEQAFPGSTAHWSCRCIQSPVTFSWKELAAAHGNSNMAAIADQVPEGTRASMDGQVSESLTFSEWLAKQNDDLQDEILGAGKAEMWRQGKIKISDLTDTKNDPLTLEDLQKKYGTDQVFHG